jgi:hypothetical protein
VNILETPQDLVQKVLDELLLQRSTCEQSVKICPEQFSDKVAANSESRSKSTALLCHLQSTHMSSRGEMKISEREMI